MRYIRRQALSERARRLLRERTRQVLKHDDPKAEARRLWKFQRNKAFNEIRDALRAMAGGRDRCMYTEDSEGTDIDHFWPLADFPEKAFDWENYLLACSRCNSNDKRNRFPRDADGEPLLINPTVDDPREHLDFAPTNGRYLHRTPKGDASITVYDLNRGILTRGRQASWTAIEACLIRYAEAKAARDQADARRFEQAIRELPFPGVLAAFLEIAKGAVTVGIDPRCLRILEEYPEIHAWGEF